MIDLLAGVAVFTPIAFIIATGRLGGDAIVKATGAVVGLILCLLYAQFAAMSQGQTFGKSVAGIRVMTKSGDPASLARMSLRLLCMPILLLLLGWFATQGDDITIAFARGAILIVCAGNLGCYLFNRGRGLPDLLARTYVAEE